MSSKGAGRNKFIIRLMGSNISGELKVIYSLTMIKGVGRRYSTIICKKLGIDTNKRAIELSQEELDKIAEAIQNPGNHDIPEWLFNRQRDIITGATTHVNSSALATKIREDLERMKKIKSHRGLRHSMHLRVRGQHTKTTGRRGYTVGVSKKKGG